MKRKNKLPRYWLGTRMPTSLGYQPNYGIGNVLYNSTPGLSIEPDVRALKNNTVPNTINKGTLYGSFITETLKNTTPMITSASRKAVGNYLANTFNEALATQNIKAGIDGTITSAAPQVGYKTALNTAGKAIAGIGAAYGLADMGFQIANNLDHRSAGQMRDTLATNTYITDLGNTYTTRGGVNRSSELDYARALKLNKNLNFTTSAIGTGAAIGSFFPGAGTAIGAGVGALVGLGANLLGFGDTEEETQRQMDLLTDAVSMENRMAESLALDKDAKQGFYGRTRSGNLSAANGKRPIHARNGYGNAMVSHGEVIGNLNEGWAYREPGVPDNNDTLKRHIAKDDFVISNKYGLSDYAASTGDLVGALLLLDMLMKYNNGKGYKCGKLPRLEGGYWDSALLAVPNIAQILAATLQYNKDRNMPVEAPAVTPDYSSARDLAYAILGDMIPSRPYMNMIDDEVARNKYAISRMPGMGMGGRAVLMDSADKTGLNEKTKQLLNIDEHNRARRETARKLLANTNAHAEDMRILTTTDQLNRYAHTNAAKYNALSQDLKNTVTPLAQLFGDWWKNDQYRKANDLKERMIKIYENGTLSEDDVKALIDKYINGEGTPTATVLPTVNTQLRTPYYILQPKFNKLPIMFGDSYINPNLLYKTPASILRFGFPSYIPWYSAQRPFGYDTNINQFK